ncbi:MAG: hypothetical protein JXR22_01315 [Prolixibacteraceae bacterium]|nr:hypothetical protein [Prolixibacteraceae bacterium]
MAKSTTIVFLKPIKNHTIRKLAAIMLVILIGGMAMMKTTFTHTHVLENGELVIHAHPYQKQNDASPFKQHTHSSYQLAMIDNLGTMFILALSPLIILLAGMPVIWFVQGLMPAEVPAMFLKGRSPPTCC